jgi:hypothetical protein
MADAEPAIPQMPADIPPAAVPPDAETRSISEIPGPMLDVHAPHQSVHTWKDFFIHIATIVVGLLIAIGLEQAVEHFHHKHQVAEVRDSLNVERRFNANRFGVLTDEFRRFVPKLETNLAVFTYLRGHPNAPVADWPGKLDWLALNLGFLDAAWKTAEQSTILQYMPRAEVQRNSELYSRLFGLRETMDAAGIALNEARRFAIQDPDPSHLSPAQLDRQIDLTMEVLLQYAQIGRAENNLARRYPDFTPSLTRDDVYGILHATTNADDQKAINALIERIDQMERELGTNTLSSVGESNQTATESGTQ